MTLGNGVYKIDPGFDTIEVKGNVIIFTASHRPDTQRIAVRLADRGYKDGSIKADGVAFTPVFEPVVPEQDEQEHPDV